MEQKLKDIKMTKRIIVEERNSMSNMKIVLISTLGVPSDQGLRTLSSVLKKAKYNVTTIFMAAGSDKFSKRGLYSQEELEQIESICRDCKLVGISSFS